MELFWIGIRESEVFNTQNLFNGNICIYGKNSFMKNKRINHNEDENWDMIDNYFSKRKKILINKNPNIKFMYYNYDGVSGKELEHCICYNNQKLITNLNNKFYTKKYFKDKVPVLDYEIIRGKDIINRKERMGAKIVLQEKEGAGGVGTTLIETNDLKSVKIDINKEYLVSKYCKNNVPVNVHILIGEDKVTLLPASVQIIQKINNHLAFMGSDFIWYRKLDDELRKKHREYSVNIGKELQKMGYRGICGIDSIFYNHEVYFMEINPRFQSSSTILNKALSEKNLPSLQYMQLKCFEGKEYEDVNIDVNYSFIMNLAGIDNNISLKPIEIYDLDNRKLIEEPESYKSTYIYDKSIYEYINRRVKNEYKRDNRKE